MSCRNNRHMLSISLYKRLLQGAKRRRWRGAVPQPPLGRIHRWHDCVEAPLKDLGINKVSSMGGVSYPEMGGAKAANCMYWAWLENPFFLLKRSWCSEGALLAVPPDEAQDTFLP